MKTLRSKSRKTGFSLIELLVGLTLSSMAMGWIGLSAMSLQRSYEAANYQMTAQNDQLRVLDYLSRDLRTATAVNVLNNGTKVSVTLPSQNAATVNLNIGPLLNGLLGAASQNATPTTVSYYVEGGQLIREVNGVQSVLADTIADLAFTRSGSYMTTDVMFTPGFSSSPTVASQQNTRASNCTYLRNVAP